MSFKFLTLSYFIAAAAETRTVHLNIGVLTVTRRQYGGFQLLLNHFG